MKLIKIHKIIGVLFVSLSVTSCASMTDGTTNPCMGLENAVVIDTKSEHMWLCHSSSSSKDFDIAIGSGGADKRKEGDHKTPLGDYTLGSPRPSWEGFHTFIPIGFPRDDQRAQGFTGGKIGIHGPPENWRWLGAATTWVNWTRGCIAVGSVDDIVEIAGWVKRHETNQVIIRG
jgi:murein L,D-transpeptidase YafK